MYLDLWTKTQIIYTCHKRFRIIGSYVRLSSRWGEPLKVLIIIAHHYFEANSEAACIPILLYTLEPPHVYVVGLKNTKLSHNSLIFLFIFVTRLVKLNIINNFERIAGSYDFYGLCGFYGFWPVLTPLSIFQFSAILHLARSCMRQNCYKMPTVVVFDT